MAFGREVSAEEGASGTLRQTHINTVSAGAFLSRGEKKSFFWGLWGSLVSLGVHWDSAEMRFGVGGPWIREMGLHSIAAVQTEHDEGGVSQVNVVKKQLLPYLY